jgi:hypothetical protein
MMTQDKAAVTSQVIGVIATQLGKEGGVGEGDKFVDLGADSLDTVGNPEAPSLTDFNFVNHEEFIAGCRSRS